MGMTAAPWLNVVSPGNLIHGRMVSPSRCIAVPVTMMRCPSRLPVMVIVGTGGAVGVTTLLGADASPHPAPLSAFTLKVYAVPLVKPETVQVSADVRHVRPPGEDVTWYVVTGKLPEEVGAVQVTEADAMPADALTSLGGELTMGGGSGDAVPVSGVELLLPT
jgi:hypothetical protein